MAVSSRSIDLDQAARMFAPRESGSTRFIAGQQLNTLTRSAYGRRLVQNSSVNIRPAVWFTEQPSRCSFLFYKAGSDVEK